MTQYDQLARAAMRMRAVSRSLSETNNLANLLVSEQEGSNPFDPEAGDSVDEISSTLMRVMDLTRDATGASTRILAAATFFASVCYRAIDDGCFNEDRDDVAALMLVAGFIGRQVVHNQLDEDVPEDGIDDEDVPEDGIDDEEEDAPYDPPDDGEIDFGEPVGKEHRWEDNYDFDDAPDYEAPSLAAEDADNDDGPARHLVGVDKEGFAIKDGDPPQEDDPNLPESADLVEDDLHLARKNPPREG